MSPDHPSPSSSSPSLSSPNTLSSTTSISPDCSSSPIHIPSPVDTSISPSIDPVILRKSTRSVKTPAYFEDYAYSTVHLANVTNSYLLSLVQAPSFSFATLSSPNKHFLNSLSYPAFPKQFYTPVVRMLWQKNWMLC